MKRPTDRPPGDPLNIDTALALLKQEERANTRRIVMSVCALMLALIFFLTFLRKWGSAAFLVPLELLLTMLVLILGVVLIPRARSHALESLSLLQDTRAVGPLLDAYWEAIGERQRTIRFLLTDLLHRVQPADYPLLSRAQQKRAAQALANADLYEETEFVVALLQALAHIGTAEACTVVEPLASLHPSAPYEERIRVAARSCLPLLKARVEQQRIGETLLRPAEGGGQDTLLRAATSGQSVTPESELLRPLTNDAGQEP